MTFYNEINSCSDAYRSLKEEEGGAFGSIQVCQDTETGSNVAIKYLKRVRSSSCSNIFVESCTAYYQHGVNVACTAVQGPGTISETVQQEIMAHRNLYHPNILLFKKTILNSQALGIVVEYQEGGSLDLYIRESWPLQARHPFSVYLVQPSCQGI